MNRLSTDKAAATMTDGSDFLRCACWNFSQVANMVLKAIFKVMFVTNNQSGFCKAEAKIMWTLIDNPHQEKKSPGNCGIFTET